MYLDCLHASGAQRSHAPHAVLNALNATDLVAVIVPRDGQSRIAEVVQHGLEAQSGTRVLSVRRGQAPWVRDLYADGACPIGRNSPFGSNPDVLRYLMSGVGVEDPAVRRSVLLWEGVDDLISSAAESFPEVVRVLGGALLRSQSRTWKPFSIHRAVLVGSTGLLEQLERMGAWLPEEVRLRYILVG
jgi:hypothetical protein